MPRAQSGSPAGFDLVLRARSVLSEPPYDEQKYIALGLFLQALRTDPNSVPAMAGTAAMYAWMFNSDPSIRRAAKLVADAEERSPDAPDVIAAKFLLLERSQRYREAMALYEHILDVAPNATSFILQVGFCACWTSAADAIGPLQRTIRLNPRSAQVDNLNVQYGRALLMVGRTEDAVAVLEPLGAPHGPDEPQAWQSNARLLLAIGYARLGRVDDAKRIVATAMKADNLREFTVRTWLRGIPRYSNPDDVLVLQLMGDALPLAGVPMQLDENADSGVPSDEAMRDFSRINTPTPMSVPGGRVVKTAEVAELLAKKNPLILTTTNERLVIPGSILISIATGGTLDDDWQLRLGRLMSQLTHGDFNRPVVVFANSLYRWHSRNLALRLIALGYRNVLWYRGGWEAWEASGQTVAPLAGRYNL